MDIIAAMQDPELFGPHFAPAETWRAWRTCLSAAFGLREYLDETDLVVFQEATGLESLPGEPVRELWAVAGRRGGKSRVASLVAVYVATLRDYRDVLTPGETGVVMILAADRRQARVCLGYVKALLDVPMLRAMVLSETGDSVTLSNGIRIEVHTASHRSTRGYTCVAAICDEMAFWRSEDSTTPDVEVLRAIRPSLATVPGSLLLCISSPYARRGALYQAFQRYYEKEMPGVLFWRAESEVMNPTLRGSRVIAEAYEDDAVSARAEWGAQFREDVESYVSPEVVSACVVPDRGGVPFGRGPHYEAFVDPSGGRRDSFTLAIGHRQRGGGGVSLNCVREWKAPLEPDAVVREIAGQIRAYGMRRCWGDRYAGEWPRERFRAHGIRYEACPRPKADLYVDLLPTLTARRIELPEMPRLVSQLAGLERRTGRSGRDSIDHAPGAQDDVANAVAGVCWALVLRRRHHEVGTHSILEDMLGVSGYSDGHWTYIGDSGRRWRV
jgi:hypothetical protein